MSEYRANTDIMRNGVTIISKATNGMSSISSRVNELANQIGGEYEGQLQEKIRPILGGLSGQGSQIQNQSEELNTYLSSSASEIDEVMQSSIASVVGAFTSNPTSPASALINNFGQIFLGGWTAILGALGFTHIKVTNINHQPTPTPGPTPAPKQVPPPQQPAQIDQGKTWTQTEIENQVKKDNKGDLPADDGTEQCVAWAIKRRKELGAKELHPIGTYTVSDLGAHNYIQIYKNSIVHINASEVSGSSLNIAGLKPGAAIVWDKGNSNLLASDGTDAYGGYAAGHIAIVEAVQPDGVWISQANWKGAPVKFIPKAKLADLYVVPPDANPG